MRKNLLFLGNDGSLFTEVSRARLINLIGVAADKVSKVEERYFGSSFSIGKKLGVPVVSQKDFNESYKRHLKTLFNDADIIFIHGYRYKIKEDLFSNKKFKLINFHQSLLPKYAGRHPINWAIIKGEKVIGITFHYVNKEFDAGDIVLQRKIRISKDDSAISIYNKTINTASRVMERVFKRIYEDSFVPIKQNLVEREYFAPRTPEDGKILQRDSVKEIKNKIRALTFPYPGAFVYLNGKRVIIDGVKKIKENKKYGKTKFVEKSGDNIILRARDGLCRVTKIRNR